MADRYRFELVNTYVNDEKHPFLRLDRIEVFDGPDLIAVCQNIMVAEQLVSALNRSVAK